MKTVIVTCMERGKPKVYTGEYISRGIGNLIFATWDSKGSSYIKQIKEKNIINCRIEQK